MSLQLADWLVMGLYAAGILSTPRSSEKKLATTTVSDWRGLCANDEGSGRRDYRLWLTILVVVTALLWFALR